MKSLRPLQAPPRPPRGQHSPPPATAAHGSFLRLHQPPHAPNFPVPLPGDQAGGALAGHRGPAAPPAARSGDSREGGREAHSQRAREEPSGALPPRALPRLPGPQSHQPGTPHLRPASHPSSSHRAGNVEADPHPRPQCPPPLVPPRAGSTCPQMHTRAHTHARTRTRAATAVPAGTRASPWQKESCPVPLLRNLPEGKSQRKTLGQLLNRKNSQRARCPAHSGFWKVREEVEFWPRPPPPHTLLRRIHSLPPGPCTSQRGSVPFAGAQSEGPSPQPRGREAARAHVHVHERTRVRTARACADVRERDTRAALRTRAPRRGA